MAIKEFGQAALPDISAFEQKHSLKLPDDYIGFLRSFNGGTVALTEQNSVYIEEFNDSINIDVLFGSKTKEEELSIELWTDDYQDEMPANTVIIGSSYQHGFIVLLCSGEDAGVYYWDHSYAFPCSNDETNTYFVSDTFSDFINGML